MSRAPKGLLAQLLPDSGADTESDEAHFAVPDAGEDDEASSLLLTPKRAVARATLDHAFSKATRRAIQRGDPVVVLIETPNAAWTSALTFAVHDLSRDVTVLAPLKPPSRYEAAETPTITQPILAVSSNLNWLAPAVVAAADVRVRATLTPAIVRSALTLAKGRTARVEMRDIAGLDLLDVASAIRPGESAPKAVRRMRAAVQSRSAGAVADTVPPLQNLVGYGPALAVVQSIADDVGRVIAGDLNATALPSFLLYGPPGTGKTQLARSFAKTAGLPMIATSVAEWFSSSGGHLGDVVTAAQRAFDQAAAASPSVLFIDELDAVPDRATMDSRSRDWWLPVVTGVLMMIDRVRERGSGVVLVGATNFRDKLDAALRRPGRFDRHVEVRAPATVEDLVCVLRHHLDGALDLADLAGVARLGLGATGAQAQDWVRQAQERARRENRPLMISDLAIAIAPPDSRSDRERRGVGIHEAGHAIVGRALGQTIVSVSIIEAGIASGATTFTPFPPVFRREDLERQVVIGLAGRAADELLSNAATSGAVGDLRKVTQMMAGIHASLGLGAELTSRTAFENAGDLVALDPALRRMVEADLVRLMKTARGIVARRRREILALADYLVAHRIANGDEVETLLAGVAANTSEEHDTERCDTP